MAVLSGRDRLLVAGTFRHGNSAATRETLWVPRLASPVPVSWRHENDEYDGADPGIKVLPPEAYQQRPWAAQRGSEMAIKVADDQRDYR